MRTEMYKEMGQQIGCGFECGMVAKEVDEFLRCRCKLIMPQSQVVNGPSLYRSGVFALGIFHSVMDTNRKILKNWYIQGRAKNMVRWPEEFNL